MNASHATHTFSNCSQDCMFYTMFCYKYHRLTNRLAGQLTAFGPTRVDTRAGISCSQVLLSTHKHTPTHSDTLSHAQAHSITSRPTLHLAEAPVTHTVKRTATRQEHTHTAGHEHMAEHYTDYTQPLVVSMSLLYDHV